MTDIAVGTAHGSYGLWDEDPSLDLDKPLQVAVCVQPPEAEEKNTIRWIDAIFVRDAQQSDCVAGWSEGARRRTCVIRYRIPGHAEHTVGPMLRCYLRNTPPEAA